jgi:hypothetical protein
LSRGFSGLIYALDTESPQSVWGGRARGPETSAREGLAGKKLVQEIWPTHEK